MMKYVQQNFVSLVGSGHREEETWHPCRIWIQISLELRTNLWVTTGHPAVYTLGLLVLVFVFHSNRPMLHGPSFRLAQSLENILRYFSLEDIDE